MDGWRDGWTDGRRDGWMKWCFIPTSFTICNEWLLPVIWNFIEVCCCLSVGCWLGTALTFWWHGFISKRPKQPHPQLVHWWVLVHSGQKLLFCWMRFPAITCSQPFSAVAIFLIETVTNVFPKFWGSHCVANIHGVYGHSQFLVPSQICWIGALKPQFYIY